MSQSSHPKALAWLTGVYSLFIVGFAAIVASLVLYQTSALHFSSDKAYGIFAAAMALIWILPLGGGYLSAKLGYVNAAKVGLLFCFLGLWCLSVQRQEALYVGLGLFVVGNAFATPAIWCLVDHCYSKTSVLRESAFTLFYLFFNLAALIGIFGGGYIASKWGFSREFSLTALCLCLSFFLLHKAEHKIGAHKGRSIAPQVTWSKKAIFGCLIAVSILVTPITILLFENVVVNNVLTILLFLFTAFLLMRVASQQKTKTARNKMIAFVFLSFIAIVFWTLYSLEPSFLSVFISNNVDTRFAGLEIPASSYFGFDSIFIVIIGLFLSRIWLLLSERGINPILSIKFSSALIIIGLGFSLLAFVIHLMGDKLIPSGYVISTYAIFALAELLVGPLGISMVGRLAPEGQEGIMMGFWQVAIGVGGVVAGYISMVPHLPSHGESLAISNPIYTSVFSLVGTGSIIAGCTIFLFIKKLKKLNL